LLLWSWKKTQSFKIDKQGRKVLNFQITMILMIFATLFFLMILPAILRTKAPLQGNSFMLVVLCAPMPFVLTVIFCMFQGVANATRALADKPIHYPLSIPFIK
jgi:uncharacterized Tic20 family protein